MRHIPTSEKLQTEPVSFWSGTFNAKVDRSLRRGAKAAGGLRRATWREIEQLLDAARRDVAIGPTDAVLPMVRKNPDIVRAVSRAEGAPPIGMFAYLPLNLFGAGLITSGGFDGTRP